MTVIKSELEAYLAEEHEEDTAEATDSAENMGTKVTAETEASVNLAESKNIAENIHKLYSPFQGVLKPITEAPDEAFASKAWETATWLCRKIESLRHRKMVKSCLYFRANMRLA